MKHSLFYLAFSLMPLLHIFANSAPKEVRPNIIVVFADDLGWKDVGYQGSRMMETPNIDALAKQGMVFSSAYAAGANCCPSRASLMTGCYTPRHGVYAVGGTQRGQFNKMRLIPVPNHEGVALPFVTMAESLKAGGYATGHFGKWHMTLPDGSGLPSQQGFDVTYDSFGEGEKTEGTKGNQMGPPSDPKGVYTLTNKACEFITAHQDKPFFVYLAQHAIHGPQQARVETLKRFELKEESLSKEGREVKAIYAACTYDLDDSVGRLLQHLDKLGLTDKTLIVFTSDNGARGSDQAPLRGNKGCYYEGGIREPFVIRWPGVTKPGSRSDVPISLVDLYPTFLAAAGITPPDTLTLDGESLLPLLRGNAALKRQAIFWYFPGYLNGSINKVPKEGERSVDAINGFRSRPVAVIRKGDFKLHLYFEEWELDGGKAQLSTNHAVELFDLSKDIGEQKNIALMNTAKRDELINDLLAWLEATKAPLPTKPNLKYDPKAPAVKGKNKDSSEDA